MRLLANTMTMVLDVGEKMQILYQAAREALGVSPIGYSYDENDDQREEDQQHQQVATGTTATNGCSSSASSSASSSSSTSTSSGTTSCSVSGPLSGSGSSSSVVASPLPSNQATVASLVSGQPLPPATPALQQPAPTPVMSTLLGGSTGSSTAAGLPPSSAVQQILQQQQNFYMQHQQQLSDLMRGQLLALQERLHLSVVHQSQLMQQLSQCRDKKLLGQLQLQIHQLSVEQHQLVQQIQMQQRHYLMQQSLSTGVSPSDLQKLWHDLTMGFSLSPQELKAVTCLNGLFDSDSATGQQRLLNGIPDLSLTSVASLSAAAAAQQSPLLHPLFHHGVCLWPSCEKPCSNYLAFIQHLNSAHTLDDRSTAQCRVQMQVVDQLEAQLNKERHRLQAMMHHLQMKQSPDTTTPANGFSAQEVTNERLPVIPVDQTDSSDEQVSTSSPSLQTTPIQQSQSSLRNILSSPAVASGAGSGATNLASTTSEDVPSSLSSRCQLTTAPASFTFTPPNTTVSVRRRVSDKSMLSIAADITRNREFYGSHDVRPPYTYASLIRQAIMESKEKQLTLNEIYNWFQDTFAYFRRNAATWKNAVRHNLSLHKCFTRVENVKGAVWTVDELEFYKRRPQRLSHGVLYSTNGQDSSFSLGKGKEEKSVKMENSDEANSDEAPSDAKFSSFVSEPSTDYQEMQTE